MNRLTAGGQPWAVVLSLVLLAGAGYDRLSLRPPMDPGPYQARVRAAAAHVPDMCGNWLAADVPADTGTQDYLRANVFLDRRLTNVSTGQQASLLLVQCGDVRDLLPHFPAVCYPGRGMTATDVRAKDWVVGGLTVTGTEYQFESGTFGRANAIVVDNFMVLPDGQFARDMKQVKGQLAMQNRLFGMGQVQVVFNAGVPQEARDAAVRDVVRGHLPLIRTILGGLKSS